MTDSSVATSQFRSPTFRDRTTRWLLREVARRNAAGHGWPHLAVGVGGVSLVALGLVFFFAPEALTALVGVTFSLPDASTDIRGFYGGMEVALGALMVAAAWRANDIRPALWLLLAIGGGNAVGRFYGWFVDSSFGSTQVALISMELTSVAVALAGLRREKRLAARRSSAGTGGAHRPAATSGPLASFAPFAPDTLNDPYPFFAALREHAPVFFLEEAGFHTVARYDDIVKVALDTETYSSNLMAILLANDEGGPALLERPSMDFGIVDVLALQDAPRHLPQGKLTNTALTLRVVRKLEDRLRALAVEMMDPFLNRATVSGEPVEWMEAYSNELPMTVALDLVGFPRENRTDVKRWCDHGVALLSGMNTPDEFSDHVSSGLELFRYVKHQVREAQNQSGREDLTAALLEVMGPAEDELSEAEVVSIIASATDCRK